MRLFTAIEIPEPIKRQIRTSAPHDRSLVPIKPEQLHLTLTFFGEIPEARLTDLKAALHGIRFPRFELHLDGNGFFPDNRNPRLFWIGIVPSPALRDLKGNIDAAAILPPEERDFIPHITLFRFRQDLKPDFLLFNVF